MVLDAQSLTIDKKRKNGTRIFAMKKRTPRKNVLWKQKVKRKKRGLSHSLLETASEVRKQNTAKRKRRKIGGESAVFFPNRGISGRPAGRTTGRPSSAGGFFSPLTRLLGSMGTAVVSPVKRIVSRASGKRSRRKRTSPGADSRSSSWAGTWAGTWVGGKVLRFGAVPVLLAAVILGGLYLIGTNEHATDDISLPEESAIEVEMLHYIGPAFEARGSGEAGIPDVSIVDTVSTFAYTIKSGETLSEIAAKHDLDVGTLISFNEIEDVRRVMAGTELTIPDVDGIPYTVKKGDSLENIAARYGIPLENLLDANDLQSAIIQPGETLFIPGGEISEYAYKKAMGTLFIYPSYGRLTSGYGYRDDPFTGIRRMHYGIDLADSIGTPVKATMAGTIASIGNQPRGYGKYVVIQHRHGFQSLYGHLSTIEVGRGQYVRQGQKLGEMGNTGRSTGSHLHFSLYKNNVPVNPLGGYLYQ